MSRTHVLVDLDGTLSDSSPGIARSLQYAFTECGYQAPTDDEVRSIIGPPFEVSFPILGVPVEEMAPVIAKYRERYNDIGLYENELYDGVVDMLGELRSIGLTLVLATAKPEDIARRVTEHFEISQHFVFEAGASLTVGDRRRTKAAVITYALEQIELPPGDHVVMLGDRDHDVEGALANGIDCVGVSWGFGSHDELHGAGARAVVDHPSAVPGAVLA